MNRYDVIVLGAGVNGLLSAIYLARAGRTVALVPGSKGFKTSYSDGWEASDGTIFPTYQNRTVDLGSEVFRELHLGSLELPIMDEGGGISFASEREPLIRDADIASMVGRLTSVSSNDANAYIEFMAYLGRQHRRSIKALRHYSSRTSAPDIETQEFLSCSVNDLLNYFFETKALKDHLTQAICNSSLVGMGLGPFAPTTAFGFFNDPIYRQNGESRTRVSINGHLVKALTSMAISNGVLIQSDTEAEIILIERARTKGVVLTNGITLQASRIVSDLDTGRTVSDLIDWSAPSMASLERPSALRAKAGIAQINLVFDGSQALREKYEPLAAMGPLYFNGDIENIEKSYDEWRAGRMPTRPPLELIFHPQREESEDPLYASIYVSYLPANLVLGEWDDARRFTLRTEVLNAINEWLPDFSSHLAHVETVTPDMFQTRFGVAQGNLCGAEQSYDQWIVDPFSSSDGQLSFEKMGLRFCGPGAALFGFETGWSGRQAALALLPNNANRLGGR